jgi:hypothetical protein
MTPEEAAAEYWATVDAVPEHRSAVNRHEKACDVLKRHMTAKSLPMFKGIELVETDGGQRLDQGKLQTKFGAKLADCYVPVVRRSLVPKRRPRATTTS